MSADGSVEALIDRLNEVDKRRRLAVVRLKEAETKLVVATQEKTEVERQRQTTQELEAQLRKDLDQLAIEQKQAEVELMVETDRVRHCDVEEPLLEAHATEQLQALERQRDSWNEKLEQLGQLATAWRDDPVASHIRDSLAAANAELQRLKTSQAEMERETLEIELKTTQLLKAREDAAASAAARSNEDSDCGGAPAGGLATVEGMSSLLTASADSCLGDVAAAGVDACGAAAFGADVAEREAASAQLVRDHITQEEENWKRFDDDRSRQVAAVEREVDDLRSRTQELQLMLLDVQRSTEQAASAADELMHNISTERCPSCAHQGS